jgi:hypothetical protein
MLVTDRRRSFGMREEQHEQDSWQGSLFAPDSLAPPARPPGSTPDPFAGTRTAPPAPPRPASAPTDAAAPPADTAAPPGDPAAASMSVAAPLADDAAAPTPPVADPDELAWPADDLDDLVELEPAHARPVPVRSVLAGPTLDDVMSRAWEGLRAEVPTPCPVCHTEIEPSAGGRCGACGSTLD